MWRTMCENTAADSQQLSACFGELGSVLSNMFHSGLWTPDDIINIIDQITITPEDWLAENVACLLHTSGLYFLFSVNYLFISNSYTLEL